ncbi:1-acyl-sn-glycerol-3-phosphate acyltransferases [Reichenbachiella agariperforans]|uniref:1-acyl-sn-glycerol-3-phosphate acyltransferases n=1 Tax=Reichenbachiella agariperforans TaxID=156994 RepID=A0A1M6LUG8_REIAG|nr:lysophospholipid acyltransferase family protein [Reichenbachiella agariperforans]SHJ74887.1 1-acyl-sn-glycerol-3-phosphate acyltransferases [Reichenbachiella agariperforans]
MQIIRFLWYYSFWLYVRTCLHFYYKRIKVVGYENVPKGVPVIFGANHQNALVDPLLMTTHVYQMTHYLVRADVFKNPFVKRFLNSLNLMAVYRARDGVNSVKANQEVFRACFDAFKENESLMLFPEGSHDSRYVVKPMKKGIARIALGGLNQPDAPEELYIVPIGLTYSGQTKFRSSVVLHYGDAIKVESKEETSANIDALKDKFEQALPAYHAAMPEEGYDYLEKVFFHNQNPQRLIEDYALINQQSRALGAKASEEDKEAVLSLSKELEKGGVIFPFEYKKNLFGTALLTYVVSPFAMVGLVLNLPVIFIPWKIMKGIKDVVFTDTIYFGVGLVAAPAVWGIYASIAYNLTASWWWALGAALGGAMSLLIYGRWYKILTVYRQNRRVRKSSHLSSVYNQFLQKVTSLKELVN